MATWKNTITCFAFVFTAFTLQAQKQQRYIDLMTDPTVWVEDGHMWVYINIGIPGILGKAQSFHKIEVYFVSESDLSVEQYVAALNFEGSSRVKQRERESRKLGLKPPKLPYEQDGKTKPKEYYTGSYWMHIPYERWMDDGVRVRIYQWDSPKLKHPVVEQEPRDYATQWVDSSPIEWP